MSAYDPTQQNCQVDATPAGPPGATFVVKNTFLHVLGDGKGDPSWPEGGSRSRRLSEPARARERNCNASNHPACPASQDDLPRHDEKAYFHEPAFGMEAQDIMGINVVDLSVCGAGHQWQRQTSPWDTTDGGISGMTSSTTSTRQVSDNSWDDERPMHGSPFSMALPTLMASAGTPHGKLPSHTTKSGSGSEVEPPFGTQQMNQDEMFQNYNASAAAASSGDFSDDPYLEAAALAADTDIPLEGDADEDAAARAAGAGFRRGRTHAVIDPVPWDRGDVVTVMVRQIPRQFTQWMFLKLANRCGFDGLFDFLYLPFDYKKNINVGYGFLSFIDPVYAQAFRDMFDGVYLDKQMKLRDRPLRVHPASVQGYEANWQHFMQTKTGQKQDPQFSPLFFPMAGCQTQPSGTSAAKGGAGEGNGGQQVGATGKGGNRSYVMLPGPGEGGVLVMEAAQAAQAAIPKVAACGNGGHAKEQRRPAPPASDATPHTSQQYPCPSCGTICRSDYRFCASCGMQIGMPKQGMQSAQTSGGKSASTRRWMGGSKGGNTGHSSAPAAAQQNGQGGTQQIPLMPAYPPAQ